MKAHVSLLLLVLVGSAAFAGLDPATDSFGVYFDTAGNTNCTTAEAGQPVTAYLLLMNPAGPTNGFECSVAMTGALHFVLDLKLGGTNPPDIGVTPYSFAVGVAADYPVPETGAVLLVTWTLMLLTPAELMFRIGPHELPSLPGGLPVVTGDGVLRLCGVASGNVDLPVAGINVGANCPVSDEATSFGDIKSLFR